MKKPLHCLEERNNIGQKLQELEKLFLLKKKQFMYFHHIEIIELIKIKCFAF